MKKTLLIVPYFGEFPYYFSLWKESAKANPDIDWIIFTDQEKSHKDKNIEFVNFSLDKLNKLASAKLNIKVEIKKSYKICDLRMAFSIVFQDYLKGYYFWGHCDLDIIWGNIKKFLDYSYVWDYDIISADRKHLCGPFCIYKNQSKTNNIWKNFEDYENVLKDDEYEGYLYDEISNERILEFDNSIKIFNGHKVFGDLITLQRYSTERVPAYWKEGNLFIEKYFKQAVVLNKNMHGFGAESMMLHVRRWHYVNTKLKSIHHKNESKEIYKEWIQKVK